MIRYARRQCRKIATIWLRYCRNPPVIEEKESNDVVFVYYLKVRGHFKLLVLSAWFDFKPGGMSKFKGISY